MIQRSAARGTSASAQPLPPGDAAYASPASFFPEVFFSIVVLLLVTVWIVQDSVLFRQHPGADWNSSEWMIDYAAGFVRRGLGGATFAIVLHLTGWPFFAVWVTFTTAAYFGLCAWLLRVTRRLAGPAVWRLALLLNPLLLISPAEYGSFARKDVMFVWGTLVTVLLAEHVVAHHQAGRYRSARSAFLLAAGFGLLSLTLALLHEGIFLFAWFPLNLAVCAWALLQLQLSRAAVASFLAVASAPALGAVLAGAVRHGDAQTARAICLSWHFAACSSSEDFPPAIRALGWTIGRDVAGCLAFAPRFPLYIAMLAIFGAVLILAVRALLPSARIEHLTALLVVPFAASVPLFLLGADWGRWLFLITASSLIVMLSDRMCPAVFSLLPPALRAGYCRVVVPPLENVLAFVRRRLEDHPLLLGIVLIMLPVPPLPIPAAMILANPVAIVLNFVNRVAVH